MKFALGSKLKCTVSGFEGIATQRVEFLNGCVQYALKPKVDKDGKMPEAQWIDEEQLEIVGKGISIQQRPGGGETPPSPGYRG